MLEAAGKSIDILKKRARPIEKVDLLGIHSTGGDALRALLKDDCRILKLSQIDAFQSVLSYVGAAFRIIGGAKGDVSVYLFLVNPTELKVVAASPQHLALNDTDLAALNDPKSAARRAASTERAVMSTSPEFDIAIGRLVPVRSGETNSGSLFVYPLKDLGSSTAQYVVSVHLSRSRSLRKSDVKLMSRVLADVEPVMLLIEKRT
ncbi:MAG: hypothetical protein SFX74_06525 [Fimbriimonadaceae bacterium]|nr:hypothetical protein [Fimbriimonadaceae bacterium]